MTEAEAGHHHVPNIGSNSRSNDNFHSKKRWHLYDFYIGAPLSNFLHYFCRLAKTQREMCVWKTRTTGSDTKWPLFALLPLIPNLTPFRFTLRLGDTSHIFIVPEYPSAKLFILRPEKEQLPTIQKLSLATIVTAFQLVLISPLYFDSESK